MRVGEEQLPNYMVVLLGIWGAAPSEPKGAAMDHHRAGPIDLALSTAPKSRCSVTNTALCRVSPDRCVAGTSLKLMAQNDMGVARGPVSQFSDAMKAAPFIEQRRLEVVPT